MNIATELMTALRESLESQWQGGRNPWLPIAWAEAMKHMLPVVEKWIRATGAAGRV